MKNRPGTYPIGKETLPLEGEGGNDEKCHASELGSASNGIKKIRDPETSSG
jgi:hypothetical protein